MAEKNFYGKNYDHVCIESNFNCVWLIGYIHGFYEHAGDIIVRFDGGNEADVRANMLIHLIENNLLGDEWKADWLEV